MDTHLTQRSLLVPPDPSVGFQVHRHVGIDLVVPEVVLLHYRIIQAGVFVRYFVRDTREESAGASEKHGERTDNRGVEGEKRYNE